MWVVQLLILFFAVGCMSLVPDNCIDAAWDLEMELLTLPCTGGDVDKMGRLCKKIDRACSDVPPHVKELGKIVGGPNAERDLHRWVGRQPWRQVLPEPYTFEVAWTKDAIHETTRHLDCYLPHETVSSMSEHPEIFEKLLCPPAETKCF